jgi:threonine dehydrogenase-like Zn-dependent dehydrogenase
MDTLSILVLVAGSWGLAAIAGRAIVEVAKSFAVRRDEEQRAEVDMACKEAVEAQEVAKAARENFQSIDRRVGHLENRIKQATGKL